MNGVFELKNASDVSRFGGKAANLAKMLQAGLPVPDGIAVGLEAFDKSGKLKQAAQQAIEELLDTKKLYAVRSSALAEDAEGASWAGQFETFLDTKLSDVISKIEECHNSTKARAKAYAGQKAVGSGFDIAVVVQEMVKAEYAGVMFTKDPVQGRDVIVVEYVKGLGEQLVSGVVTPKSFEWDKQANNSQVAGVPFDAKQLVDLGLAVEFLYGIPQDIEWTVIKGKVYLVQTRPITMLPEALRKVKRSDDVFYLGEPGELFYWGPSRAKAMFMSDFGVAAEEFFKKMSADPAMPKPPKTLVLFHDSKVVWLINAKAFSTFTRKTFTAYEKRDKLDEDVANWHKTVVSLDAAKADAEELVEAWLLTLFAEFSLYGAESALARRLDRFEPKVSQTIWGAFTVPDNSTFLGRIDEELLSTSDPATIAKKYPWIEDGYSGTYKQPEKYFTERLKMLQSNTDKGTEDKKDRQQIVKDLKLSKSEVRGLDLTRQLADFMDERKQWMMRTRRNITKIAGNVEYGWLFDDGEVTLLNEEQAAELWEQYVDFKASESVVQGIVASNGGRHFMNGEVQIAHGPTDNVADDRILVVTATSPSYVPLMRKARALVTDHGGMMSHAAIVAREFNLPCIVGTVHGTKVLKDGDKVVLDLIKGTVNK